MTADVFGTRALRRSVTEAWLASPTRFREDANTEEDHARGYYRGRVVVELAQNAADAAARAGVEGRLLLRLEPDDRAGGGFRLIAANTGAPLDADGVASLASMRASAKGTSVRGATASVSGREGAHHEVGRFGVGFAAVRSVSDEIWVVSEPAVPEPASPAAAGIHFSLNRSRALLDELLRGEAADPPVDTTSALSDVSLDVPAPTLPHDAYRAPYAQSRSVGAGTSALARAVVDRGDALPVLRLPFTVDAADPGDGVASPHPIERVEGYRTTVVLELRDAAAVAEIRAQLAEVDDALLLALPALSEVVVVDDGVPRTLSDVAGRWTVVRASGELDPALLADRPVEERRTTWSVLWALPRAEAAGAPSVLHAPTPTDVRLTFPALLIATFPLDPSRRHVPAGPATDAVAEHAGAAYAELLARVATGAATGQAGPSAQSTDALALVPLGLPASELDASIRAAAIEALRDTPLLRAGTAGTTSTTDPQLVEPAAARVLLGATGRDPAVLRALGRGVPNLVPVAERSLSAARLLGATVSDLAEVVDELPAGLGPEEWREIYAAFLPHVSEPNVLESLGAIPVPLADGRRAHGARGLVLLPGAGTTELDPAALADWGLRVVDPAAEHPLLERLGATVADARALLYEQAVREHVLDLADGGSGEPGQADAGRATVLDLVRVAVEGGADVEDLPFWLGELPLETVDGETLAARECVLPGSWSAGVLEASPVAAELVARWGADVLRAVGVQADVSVYRVADVLTPASGEGGGGSDDPTAPESWLTGWSDYLDHLTAVLGPQAYLGDLTGVADLDAVVDEAWPDVLGRIAADPAARAALLEPVRDLSGATSDVRGPSYTAWWLRDQLGAPFAAAPGTPFLASAPPAVHGLDTEVLRALGGIDGLEQLDLADWPTYLDALPDVGTVVALPEALAVWRGLASLAARSRAARRDLAELPDRLPGLCRGRATVRAAEDLTVAQSPMWAQVRDVVPGATRSDAEALADLLDLPLAPAPGSSDVPAPETAGEPQPVDVRVRALAAGIPATWFEHDDLRVAGRPVEWWVSAGAGDTPAVHAATTAGLARGLATACGRWELRHLVEAVLLDPGSSDELAAETAWDRKEA